MDVPVARVAGATGIADARDRMTPADKLAAPERLAQAAVRVLMVGDGSTQDVVARIVRRYTDTH